MLGNSTMRTNGVFKCIDELAVCFHTIDLCYIGLGAKEELRACRTIVDGRGVGVDCVGGDGFIATVTFNAAFGKRYCRLRCVAEDKRPSWVVALNVH